MGVFATFRPSSPSDASPSIHLPGIKCSDDDRETRQHRKAVENGEGLPPHTPSGTHHTAARRPQPSSRTRRVSGQRPKTTQPTSGRTRRHSHSLYSLTLTRLITFFLTHPHSLVWLVRFRFPSKTGSSRSFSFFFSLLASVCFLSPKTKPSNKHGCCTGGSIETTSSRAFAHPFPQQQRQPEKKIKGGRGTEPPRVVHLNNPRLLNWCRQPRLATNQTS